MSSAEAFQPTEIWTPRDAESYQVDPRIDAVRREMNAEDTKALIRDLKAKVERKDGQAYAVLDGDRPQDYSTTDALVLFDTFSVGASANRLVRAEFIRRVAEKYGVTDEQGKFKPVILLASPGPGSTVKLTKDEKAIVAGGELGILAERMLRVVKDRDIGRVAFLGFSQGAPVAMAGALEAYSLDMDATHLGIGDPTTSEERNLGRLGKDFQQGSDFKPSMDATNLNAQRATLNMSDMARMLAGFFKPINWSIAKGLGHDSFEATAQTLLREGDIEKFVVGYGSVMAKAETIEPELAELKANDANDVLTTIKLVGTNHTWGDELPLLAKLYMRALV